ncbi:MAG: hypothetical protein JSR59_18150 [Proteobacteria bacterium]|nr:hypothetical protein [Pseudomonadota bacterium]
MLARYLLPALLIAAGCSTTNQQQTVDTSSAQQVTCQQTYRVGSNIPVKTCDAALSEADRQRIRDEMQQSIRPTATQPPGKGG